MKVNSKPTIRLLTKKFIRSNRGRNLIAILAIIMTTVMFTSLFTATVAVVRTNMQMDMRNAMSSSNVIIQDLTKEQFDQIRQDTSIDRYGYNIFMSLAENPELGNSQTEIRYADENGAECYMSSPSEGRLPERENEIAMNTITMDLLGVPRQLGSPVTITCTLNGQKMTKEFVLSGYWEGDPIVIAQEVWVSEEFCLKYAKKATAESLEEGDFEGAYGMSIWYSSLYQIQQKMENLDDTYGISMSQAVIALNPALDKMIGEDGFSYGTVGLILAVIFISGYLIIFNVFYISVQYDIREYGLLKNIGTTGRQLKSIVLRQAAFLGIIGISAGLVVGYFVGNRIAPYLVESDAGGVLTAANPVIFLAAALFSAGTVYISCMKPCQMVAKLSPVEALRTTGMTPRKKRKSTRKVTPYTMAAGTICRTWKKSVIVILSLTLPVVILNSVFIIQKGFDYDKFIKTYISSDFNISGCTNNASTSNLKAVTPQFQSVLAQREEIESIAYVYNTKTTHQLDENGYVNLAAVVDKAQEFGVIKGRTLEREKDYVEGRNVICNVMGIDENAFDKMELPEEIATWQQFSQGDYLIAGGGLYDLGDYYRTGDVVALSYGPDGTSKEYTVLAVGDLPLDMEYPFSSGTYFDYSFYVPAEEYIAVSGNDNAMRASVDLRDGMDKQFGAWLDSEIQEGQRPLYVESVLSLEKDCKQFSGRYYLILGILGTVIFIIGVLNFFNTSAVSVMSRKRELSLLEAVGMTKKQIKKMLMYEGLFYLVAPVVIADTVGMPAVKWIVGATAGKAFYFTYHPDITASIVILPILVAIAVVVPLYHYHKICSQTIVERIRIED